MEKRNHSRKDELIGIAENLVMRDGAAALTLDAVAHEANFSKGGVLYHFPSKDALVQAMVEHLMERFEDALNQNIQSDPRLPGAFTRAYIRASLQDDPGRMQELLSTSSGLIAALAINPALLEAFRHRMASWQIRLENDGLDIAHAMLVRLAVDGWWYSTLFSFAPPEADAREKLLNLLTDLAGGPGEL
jgi:AcrR family transcriptional regulator